MATYKEIKGTQIEVLASDPSNPVDGQVWYNSTDNVLKGNVVLSASSFATGGSLNTGRYNFSGTGTQTAGLVAGGSTPSNTGITELYNGSNWTETTDLNTARNTTSQGTAATQTATIVWGGYPSYPGSYRTETELWNGSNWTEVNDLNAARRLMGGAGNITSALCFGGTAPPTTAANESWNGTSWTEVGDLNTARHSLAGIGADNTSALAIGGDQPNTSGSTVNEQWNGASWAEVGDLNTGRRSWQGISGTTSAGLTFGGGTPGVTAATEEWSGSSNVTKTIDTD
jgi:hypothetical protein